MNPKQSSERAGGYRNRLATIATIGSLGGLAFFAANTAPDASAKPVAAAEQAQTKETLSQRTEKQLQYIHAHIKAMVKNHKHHGYQEFFMENGVKNQRLVTSLASAEYGSYTQLVEETVPGEKLPHMFLIIDGAPTPRYSVHEPSNRAQILVRDDSRSGQYGLAMGLRTSATTWQNDYYKFDGNSITHAKGKATEIPISLDAGTEVMENFTSEAKDLLSAKPVSGTIA